MPRISLFRLLFPLLLLLSSSSSATAAINDEIRILTQDVWDLADVTTTMAELFFSSSNVTATLYIPSTESTETTTTTAVPRIEWTATTPVPVACGASILSIKYDDSTNSKDYYWKHVFSQAMDPGTPSVDHVVSIDLDNDNLSQLVDMRNSSLSNGLGKSFINAIENYNDVGNQTTMISSFFRLFAFFPFGKGVIVSRIYSLELPLHPLSLWWNANNDDGDSFSPLEKKDYELSIQSLDDEVEAWFFDGGPLPAGESSLAFSQSESGNDGDVVTLEVVDNSLIQFRFTGQSKVEEGGEVAAAFQYGLEIDGEEGRDSLFTKFSAEAFNDTDGIIQSVENGGFDSMSITHGLVRAQDVSMEPYAFIPLLSTSLLTPADVGNGHMVVSGVWIDDQMMVHHSLEERFPLSEYYVNTTVPSSSSATDASRNSNLCPPESMRNLALLSEGATILSVSSNYGTIPSAVSSNFGAEKAIDGDEKSAWSSAGDGNDAYISIQLPFSSNVIYVDFHTRTMVTSAQVSEYQVEIDSVVAASGCGVMDAIRPYECDLEGDGEGIGVKNASVVTFRVVDSSGGNTGAVSVGVYGCNVDEEPTEPLPTQSEKEDVPVEVIDGGLGQDGGQSSLNDEPTEVVIDNGAVLGEDKPAVHSGGIVGTVSIFIACLSLVSACFLASK